jgi:hypothetical protein
MADEVDGWLGECQRQEPEKSKCGLHGGQDNEGILLKCLTILIHDDRSSISTRTGATAFEHLHIQKTFLQASLVPGGND